MTKTEPSVRSNHDFDMHGEVSTDRGRCYTNVSTLYVFRPCSRRISCCTADYIARLSHLGRRYIMKPLIDKCSAAAEMGYRLATIDMGRKFGDCAPFWGGGAGSPSNTMWPGPRPTSVPNLDSSNRLATIYIGQNCGVLLGRGALPPWGG